MTKRILFTVIIVWLTLTVVAQKVSRDEAERFVLMFLEQSNDTLDHKPRLAIQPRTDPLTFTELGGRTFMYFVQTIDDGWVVVSADRRITPILAMGEGIMSPIEDAPPGMLDLFSSYAYEMQYMLDSTHITEQHPGWNLVESNVGISQGYNSASISGEYTPGTILLNKPHHGKIRWNQKEANFDTADIYHSYNKFCPDWYNASQGRCLVGCTAVAIGQIMWYWQWPHAANIPERVDKIAGTAFGNEFHEYYWSLMPNAIYRKTTMAEIDEIAGFLRDCGYALNSVYKKNGTTSDLVQAIEAFKNRFQYHCSALLLRMFYNKTKWDNRLKSEIDAGRPVLYGGSKKDLSDSHAFIIDGYKYSTRGVDDILFHINWGWGGESNGFFTIKLNNKEDSQTVYPYWQMAVCEIYPKCNENSTIKDKTIRHSKTKPYYASYGGNLQLQNVTVTTDSRAVFYAGNAIIIRGNCSVQQGAEAKVAIRDINCSSVVENSRLSEVADAFVDIPLHERHVNGLSDIRIHPNPTKDVIYIDGISPDTKISIVNLQGLEMLSFDNVDTPLDVSFFPSGIYFIKVFNDDKFQIVRLIKH